MKIAKRMLLIIVCVVCFSISVIQVRAWEPGRDTYTNQNPADHPVFNSITDNAAIGDKRDFVRIAEKYSGNAYSSEIVVEPGKQYEVYILSKRCLRDI